MTFYSVSPDPIGDLPVVAEPSRSYPPGTAQWVEALVDCPGAQGLYTYRCPPELAIAPGDILSVPFGSQQVGAIAIRMLERPPVALDSGSIREVDDITGSRFFPAHYWILLEQVATYYQTPLIQVIRTALPPGLLGRSQRRIRLQREAIPPGGETFVSPVAQQILETLRAQKQGDYTWQYLQRQVRGADRGLRELLQRGWVESYLEPPSTVRPKQRQVVTLVGMPPDLNLTARQTEILEILKRRGGELGLQELLHISHVSSSVVKALAQKGCVVIQSREVLRTGVEGNITPDMPKDLTPGQQEALQRILSLNHYAQVLLHGVTGSGKTEVYLQAIAPVLQRGQSALVLVPEIGLTPQLTDRFQARFGGQVQVYHSALSDGERYDTWRAMLTGTPQIVIGTRSAIFAPLPNLGMIILDEEHDSSFKQDQPAPCYHARTVAQWRAALCDCPLILGSATPAVDTWFDICQNSLPGNTQTEIALSDRLPVSPQPEKLYLSLPTRIHARPLPPVQIVDMRSEFQAGNRSIFSRPLQIALEDLQQTQQQGILFIHRRGHSTFVSCRACGYVVMCPHCDVSLSYHHTHAAGLPLLRCHYCGYQRSHPTTCPECNSAYLKNFGSGTQRVVQELQQHYPELRCLRFDSDTTRTKGSHRALLTQFANGEADILVGTQMLTKGIDLPQVTLVGVVAADGLLNLADYRASERAFQTLTQVAGRAGRGETPGRVIIQTYAPEHPVIQAVEKHHYHAFIEQELLHRRDLHYPPYGQLILLRLSSPDQQAVIQTAETVGDRLRPSDPESAGYALLGPAPASVPRVARRYRWQILLKRLDPDASLPNLEEVRSLCPSSVSLTIDVDPLNFM